MKQFLHFLFAVIEYQQMELKAYREYVYHLYKTINELQNK